MGLDTVLKNFQRNVPGCVTASIVDIDRDPGDRRSDNSVDLVAATMGELVHGQDVMGIEDMFKRIRGTTDEVRHQFQEIVIISDSRMHLFQRCKRNPNKVLATTCHKDASLGVVMVKSRDMLEVLDLAI